MPKNSALRKNTGALLAIQISNFALPFVITPYLTYTLGAKIFGVIAFGLSLTQIACIITDYGFNLSATYKIAKNHSNKDIITKIYSAVFACKFGLLGLSSLLISIFLYFDTQYAEYHNFLLLLILPIAGQTFQPVWLFQGIEKMSYITIYSVASKLIYIALVITLVKSQEDYYLTALALGVANIIAAVLGIGMLAKMGYTIRTVSIGFIKETFKESTEFFWSRAAVATYTAAGAFVVGIVSTPVQVAYYSAAEQIYKGGQAIFSPLAQALYPYMAKTKNIKLFSKILKASILVSLAGSVVGFYLGNSILEHIFGPAFIEGFPILSIFLITLTINTPSILIGYPFVGALGNSSTVNRSVLYGGATQISLLVIFYFLNLHQAIYIATTVLIAEIVVLAIRSHSARTVYLNLLK